MISRKFFLVAFSCSVIAINAELPKAAGTDKLPVSSEKAAFEKVLSDKEKPVENKDLKKERKEPKKEEKKESKLPEKKEVVPSADLWLALKARDIEAFAVAVKAGQNYKDAIVKEAHKGNTEGVVELSFQDNACKIMSEKCEAESAKGRWFSPETKFWLGSIGSGALGLGLGYVITKFGQLPFKFS